MPMTPDEVVKVLEQEIKDWQEACASYENTAQEERKEEGCAALETLKDIERANEKIIALKSSISLIQDYQKLMERIDVNKIGNIIKENLGTHKNFETWLIEKDNISQAIVTYLQQPTEH
jgi:hypothetical protein